MAKLKVNPLMRGLLTVTWMATASLVAVAQPVPYPGAQTPHGPGEFVVRQAEGAPTLSIGGTVVPYKEVTLAAQLPGRVTYLAGIEGDKF